MSFIRMADLSWGNEETSLFISNFIKQDILRIILTNGVLYLYDLGKNKNVLDDIDDVVQATAKFLNIQVFYTDGVIVSVPECGDVSFNDFYDLVDCNMLRESFILSVKSCLWSLNKTIREKAILYLEKICMKSRKGMFGVVIPCPLNGVSDYELYALKRNTEFHIIESKVLPIVNSL